MPNSVCAAIFNQGLPNLVVAGYNRMDLLGIAEANQNSHAFRHIRRGCSWAGRLRCYEVESLQGRRMGNCGGSNQCRSESKNGRAQQRKV